MDLPQKWLSNFPLEGPGENQTVQEAEQADSILLDKLKK